MNTAQPGTPPKLRLWKLLILPAVVVYHVVLLQSMVLFKVRDNHSVAFDTVRESPAIIWLASYPNSGTSYTMTLVEGASQMATASNYGNEVTPKHVNASIPVHADHPEGPYWKGLERDSGRVLELPDRYILTKTHCGGRCLRCPPNEYIIDTNEFMLGCQRTTATIGGHSRINEVPIEHAMSTDRVAKLVHLIRNPIQNVVARYHLDRRHLLKSAKQTEESLPNNATGFHEWCAGIDEASEIMTTKLLDSSTLENVPCRAEFYRYVRWHDHVIDMIPEMHETGRPPVLILHYEDYEYHFTETASELMRFVEQKVVDEMRPFRPLPDYTDHFTEEQLSAIRDFLHTSASPFLWTQLARYFNE